jgi:rubrerythrin
LSEPGTSTRRASAHRALALGGAALAAGSVPALLRARGAFAKTRDAAVLTELIELEQRAEVAYRSLAGTDLLDQEIREAADLFADQEHEHVEALTAALEDLGGRAPKEPPAGDVEGLSELDGQEDALRFLVDLENEAIAAFADAAAELRASDLLKTGAQIVANDAQHLAVLRQQLGEDPAPGAFEDGSAQS